jgi:hypothetical protein
MFKKIALGAAFSVFAFTAHASQPMDLEPSALQAQAPSFAKVYTHKNVQEQIADYDRVYTPEVTEVQPHIQGLFEITERIFSYTYQYIQQQENHKKAHACGELEKLYKTYAEINQKQQFNGKTLHEVCTYLMGILDRYKGSLGCVVDPESARYNYQYLSIILYKVLPVIILSNLNYQKYRTFISYKTIVDQYFKPGSRRWVYQIEPNCINIGGGEHTKKLPHYEGGSLYDRSHDFNHDHQHHREHAHALRSCDELPENLLRIRNIQEYLKKDQVAYEVITNALFYFIHETADGNSCRYLDSVREWMQDKVGAKRDYVYKISARDNERLLKTKNSEGRLVSLVGRDGPFLQDASKADLLSLNAQGKTLFSQLKPHEKQEAVKAGYGRFWSHVTQILKDNGFRQ